MILLTSRPVLVIQQLSRLRTSLVLHENGLGRMPGTVKIESVVCTVRVMNRHSAFIACGHRARGVSQGFKLFPQILPYLPHFHRRQPFSAVRMAISALPDLVAAEERANGGRVRLESTGSKGQEEKENRKNRGNEKEDCLS